MRLKFRKQASKIKQELAYSNIDFWRGLTKTVKLATILFLLLGSWGTIEIAQAETARIDDITIDRQPDETYESLIGRAEAAARSAVQQGFEQGNRVTDVSVVVLGQNQGTIAPVLVVELSRFQWNNSDVQSGMTYFSSARLLLGLEEQQLANTNPNQPSASENSPTPPGGQQNDANSPTNSRQVIESIPAQPVTPPTSPGISPPPLPGGPALTPNPQEPATPDSSSDNNSNPNSTNNTPQTNTPSGDSSQQNITPPPVNNSTPQITGPTPGNEQSLPSLPQGTPSNNTNSNTPLLQP